MTYKTIAVSLIALAAAAPLAAAQSFGGPPAYGEVVYRSGAAPVSANVRAGGAISADRLGENCQGYINEAPTIALDLREGGRLYIAGATDEDTTLIVRGPDGALSCDDDGAGFPHPGISYDDAAPGRYEVWLATYTAGVGYPAGAIHISSDAFITDNPFTRAPNPELPAQTRVRLNAGFSGDPRRINVTAGGEAPLDLLATQCFGFASEAPSAQVTYRAGAFDLYFTLQTEGDATLAVRTPSGAMLCNDDQDGLNSGVVAEDPESGVYLVWAGELGERGATEAGVLAVSEIGFNGIDNRLDVNAPARFGAGRLTAGFIPDPFILELEAGGPSEARLGLGDGVVAEGSCAGFVTSEPSYELDFQAGSAPLYISATGDSDLTLVVNAPDGAWYCNDDFDSLDPALEFTNAQSGVYDIYVGTYSQVGAAPANLFISELHPGPEQTLLDVSRPAISGDHALSAGFSPDPYTIEVAAGGPFAANDGGAGADDLFCSGNVTVAPTAQLSWDGVGDLLSFYVASDVDTTLVVNMPDGSWMCDDDGGEGFDAALTLQAAPSGVYDIWVGRFASVDPAPAVLAISEFVAPTGGFGE
jgi:hypothetical protein